MQSAHRKQVRQPGVAHGLVIRFGNGPAIAAGQSGCNGPRRTVQIGPDVLRKLPLRRCDGPALSWLEDFNRTKHAACRGDPGKPGGAGKVIAPRQHRRRRRDKPRPQAEPRAFFNRTLRLIQRQVQPHLDRSGTARFAGRQDQAHALLRRLVLTVQHGRFQRCGNGARDRPCPNKLCLDPDQSAAECHGNAHDRQGAAQVRIAPLRPEESDCSQGDAKTRAYDRPPVPGAGRDEPAGDPCNQRHQPPGRKVEPRPDKESFNLLKPAGQVASHAPRAMLQCSGMRRIAAHRHLRQSFATHGSR